MSRFTVCARRDLREVASDRIRVAPQLSREVATDDHRRARVRDGATSLPRRSGTPIRSKYPGVTTSIFDASGIGRRAPGPTIAQRERRASRSNASTGSRQSGDDARLLGDPPHDTLDRGALLRGRTGIDATSILKLQHTFLRSTAKRLLGLHHHAADGRRDHQEERLREHHLRDHERVLQARSPRRAARRVLECRRHSVARRVQRRREPAQNSRAEGDTHREGDRPEIRSEELGDWNSRNAQRSPANRRRGRAPRPSAARMTLSVRVVESRARAMRRGRVGRRSPDGGRRMR